MRLRYCTHCVTPRCQHSSFASFLSLQAEHAGQQLTRNGGAFHHPLSTPEHLLFGRHWMSTCKQHAAHFRPAQTAPDQCRTRTAAAALGCCDTHHVVLAAVAALSGLQRCIAQHASNFYYINGWNISTVSSSDAASAQSASASAAVTASLAAMGVPGVGLPSSAAGESPGGFLSDPCGIVPWTGLVCTGDRIIEVYAPQSIAYTLCSSCSSLALKLSLNGQVQGC